MGMTSVTRLNMIAAMTSMRPNRRRMSNSATGSGITRSRFTTVADLDEPGELPFVIAFEATEKAARERVDDCHDLDEADKDHVRVEYLDLHRDRYDFDPKDWRLFGQPYVPCGYDVAVPHGTKPLSD